MSQELFSGRHYSLPTSAAAKTRLLPWVEARESCPPDPFSMFSRIFLHWKAVCAYVSVRTVDCGLRTVGCGLNSLIVRGKRPTGSSRRHRQLREGGQSSQIAQSVGQLTSRDCDNVIRLIAIPARVLIIILVLTRRPGLRAAMGKGSKCPFRLDPILRPVSLNYPVVTEYCSRYKTGSLPASPSVWQRESRSSAGGGGLVFAHLSPAEAHKLAGESEWSIPPADSTDAHQPIAAKLVIW